MAIWAIGDLQGCLGPTERLLERIRFDPARDRLWFCGDLVNRGGESLETLRLVHSLRANAVTVLGNHDLSLLAIADRREDEQRKVNADLQRVLFAPDRDELLDWLRVQPLVHADHDLGWMMVHAGLAPKWTVADAEALAREVEASIQGKDRRRLFKQMYGDRPAWSPGLRGTDRERAIINTFTRMRYCSPRGRIAFEEKGAPGTQQPGLYPWYAVPGRIERGLKVVCGHWSSLGLFIGHGVHAIDTGAVWGGMLTALRLDSEELQVVQVPGRPQP
ncbi:symmetrical bis(5'-nucleosyl)-tetraphosphatase [Luteimonas sp. MC1782]|uniref:symmetrical bis(5'-nucleosyl)-tetraphosphatase n=1 Tax=Luteimonas sp. MC1782 TaxID=2760305 RepID=UPI0015FFB2E4|nr:symmetrical bis(5'-nucleosyl)-tetraphosphatase [Luteimonas sp. MC1782]MBB1473869.1 symmetrical bis(5'-nucleosyl)-tetraphosphatase [Luteimonas sp. MC1782]